MSDNNSMVPWLVAGGALLTVVGGGLYLTSQNTKAQAEVDARLKAAEDRAALERELAAARAGAGAQQQQQQGGGGGNPLDGFGQAVNAIGGAVKGITDFFSGWKL